MFKISVGEAFTSPATTNASFRDGDLTNRYRLLTGETLNNSLSRAIKDLKDGDRQKIEPAIGLYFVSKVDLQFETLGAAIDASIFGTADVQKRNGSYSSEIGISLARLRYDTNSGRYESTHELAISNKTRIGDIVLSYERSPTNREFRKVLFKTPSEETDQGASILDVLHWSSGVTQLRGRDAEIERLASWAQSEPDVPVKILILSGPGGSGKTHLAADAIQNLCENERWAGGFLPRDAKADDCFYAGKIGTIFAIDYPEERTDLARSFLNSGLLEASGHAPIRIILVSRERMQDWLRGVNDPNPKNLDELNLYEKPYLSVDDALKSASDSNDKIAALVGAEPAALAGAKSWFNEKQANRSPLIVLASVLHAVLVPEKAFALRERDVLLALADLELSRVKSYSERQFSNRRVIEIFLGLSLFAYQKIDKKMLFSLGEIVGDVYGVSAGRLVSGISDTPFWSKGTASASGSLIRVEPDRVAAAISYRALELDDPDPFVGHCISVLLNQKTQNSSSVLIRAISDLSYLSARAAKNTEALCIDTLKTGMLSSEQFVRNYKRPSPFLSRIAVEALGNKVVSWNREFGSAMPLAMTRETSAVFERLSDECAFQGLEGPAEELAELNLKLLKEAAASAPDQYRLDVVKAQKLLSQRRLESEKLAEAHSLCVSAMDELSDSDSADPEVMPLVSEITAQLASISAKQGMVDWSYKYAATSRDLCDCVAFADQSRIERSLLNTNLELANLAMDVGDSRLAKEVFQAATDLFQQRFAERDDSWIEYLFLQYLKAKLSLHDDDSAKTCSLLETLVAQSESYYRFSGDFFRPHHQDWLVKASDLAREAGNLDLARALASRAILLTREIGDGFDPPVRRSEVSALCSLALTEFDDACYPAAKEYAELVYHAVFEDERISVTSLVEYQRAIWILASVAAIDQDTAKYLDWMALGINILFVKGTWMNAGQLRWAKSYLSALTHFLDEHAVLQADRIDVEQCMVGISEFAADATTTCGEELEALWSAYQNYCKTMNIPIHPDVSIVSSEDATES